MDLKGVLNEKEEEDGKKEQSPVNDASVRVHKKPIQLRDIENRSSTNRKTSLSHESDEKIKKLLNKEKKQYYKQVWNKLDNGMKINRLKLFVESEREKNELNVTQCERLKTLLITSCTSGKLNKSSDIVTNSSSLINSAKLASKSSSVSLPGSISISKPPISIETFSGSSISISMLGSISSWPTICASPFGVGVSPLSIPLTAMIYPLYLIVRLSSHSSRHIFIVFIKKSSNKPAFSKPH